MPHFSLKNTVKLCHTIMIKDPPMFSANGKIGISRPLKWFFPWPQGPGQPS